MKPAIRYTLKVILLLFLIVPMAFARKNTPPRMDLRIDLEWTVDEFLANAPTTLPNDAPKYSLLKTFLLYNVDSCVTYQGKEISFKGAGSTFLTYQYEVPVSIEINNLDGHTKTLLELKKKLKVLLPAIDALGFKREEVSEKFSSEKLPLPEKYTAENRESVKWASDDRLKLLRLIISVPTNPEIYLKEKRYFLSFVYYDQTDEKVLKKNWLKKRNNDNNG